MGAAHIHSPDEVNTEHCQVCVVAKVFESTDVSSVNIVLAVLSIDFSLLHWQHTIEEKLHFKGYYSTAPPL